jgi:hypothetical protein
MIEHMMRALLGYETSSLFCASRANHFHSHSAGELYGCNPHTSTRAVHENHLAGTGLRSLEESAISGRIRHVDCRALGEGGSLG